MHALSACFIVGSQHRNNVLRRHFGMRCAVSCCVLDPVVCSSRTPIFQDLAQLSEAKKAGIATGRT